MQTVTEEKDRIDLDLEELEQYTRKTSIEIHGLPQEAYTATEDVVLKIGEVLDVPISPGDIEISHQLNSQNKPIIVKFLSHKVKSSLYKKRTATWSCLFVSIVLHLNHHFFLKRVARFKWHGVRGSTVATLHLTALVVGSALEDLVRFLHNSHNVQIVCVYQTIYWEANLVLQPTNGASEQASAHLHICHRLR